MPMTKNHPLWEWSWNYLRSWNFHVGLACLLDFEQVQFALSWSPIAESLALFVPDSKVNWTSSFPWSISWTYWHAPHQVDDDEPTLAAQKCVFVTLIVEFDLVPHFDNCLQIDQGRIGHSSIEICQCFEVELFAVWLSAEDQQFYLVLIEDCPDWLEISFFEPQFYVFGAKSLLLLVLVETIGSELSIHLSNSIARRLFELQQLTILWDLE